MKHKDGDWLRHQYVDNARSVASIAADCSTSPDAIVDAIRKAGLHRPPATGDTDCLGCLDGRAALRCYGRERRQIPLDVLAATVPADTATVAILGAGGFVGANLTAYLRANSRYRLLTPARQDCDAMRRDALLGWLQDAAPDVVVNLAAFVGGIGLNKDRPGDMIYRNLVMSANVVDCCFTAGVRKLVSLGSVCSFPHTPPTIPFVESDLWAGRPEPTNEPYGVAKKTCGLMLDAYKRQFNFCSAYLIPTNMYGPHDDFGQYGSHVIPAMIRKFCGAVRDGATTVVNWGDGTASRDFLYVDDCCEAIRLAIARLDDPEPLNIGSGRELTMAELSEAVAAAAGYCGRVAWDSSKPNGQPRRCLNTDRAKRLLGFEARTDFSTGLAATVRWYTENYHAA